MGDEPTGATIQVLLNGFEDRGARCTPTLVLTPPLFWYTIVPSTMNRRSRRAQADREGESSAASSPQRATPKVAWE